MLAIDGIGVSLSGWAWGRSSAGLMGLRADRIATAPFIPESWARKLVLQSSPGKSSLNRLSSTMYPMPHLVLPRGFAWAPATTPGAPTPVDRVTAKGGGKGGEAPQRAWTFTLSQPGREETL